MPAGQLTIVRLPTDLAGSAADSVLNEIYSSSITHTDMLVFTAHAQNIDFFPRRCQHFFRHVLLTFSANKVNDFDGILNMSQLVSAPAHCATDAPADETDQSSIKCTRYILVN